MADFELSNFCVAFIDLLGQRDAMKGQGLLPQFKSEDEEKEFRLKIKDSIGQIVRLQENAQRFLAGAPELSIKDQLSGQDLEDYKESTRLEVKQQRWSDGLVLYTTMRGRAPMNAIFFILGTAGCICFAGLGQRDPIRGGIDVSWGAELHDSELYGPVVANSYELETVAQYPRIVIGDRLVQYLQVAIRDCDETDKVQLFNKALAQMCLEMICEDSDGFWILNYLGEAFTEAYTKENSPAMFKEAYEFAEDQYQQYKRARNTKLATRYNWLLAYLEAHRDLHGDA